MHSVFTLRYSSRVHPFTLISPTIRIQPISNRRLFGTLKLSQPFEPSQAQLAVVEACKTHNVVVSARPGSGKTATAEAIVRANPSARIAIITYSKRLQIDTKKRLGLDTMEGQLRYPNVDVFTFHGCVTSFHKWMIDTQYIFSYSMAGKLFGEVVKDDVILNNFRARLREDERVKSNWHPIYDIVILDEMQDLTGNLFWLTRLFMETLALVKRQPPRFIVLGDSRQTIFGHNDADAQYLDLAQDILSDITPHAWKVLKLDESFRLSHETTAFINAFIGEDYIQGSRPGPMPIYLHANVYDSSSLVRFLYPLIREYGPENTAILAPSVRSKTSRGNHLIPSVTNKLSYLRIPVAEPTSDSVSLDDKVLKGKLAISTYHQFKGCERDLVIVYGIDASYFKYYAKNLSDDHCSNAMFVALTRAREQLIVIQDHQYPAMPFMLWEKIRQTANYIPLIDRKPRSQTLPGRPIQRILDLPESVTVTEIPRGMNEERLQMLVNSHLRIEKQPPSPKLAPIKVNSKVLTDKVKKHYEFVGDLNGLAVAAAFEWERAQTCTTLGYTGKESGKPDIPEDPMRRARWFAKNALKHQAKQGIYESRRIQMRNHAFDWLGHHLEDTTKRMLELFPDFSRLKFEVPLKCSFRVEYTSNVPSLQKEIEILGRADIIDDSPPTGSPPAIWEIKFTDSLDIEYVVQLAIYGYLWSKQNASDTVPDLVLYNVKDGEKWRIKTTLEDLKKFIEAVLKAKYNSNGQKDRATFLRECKKISEEVASVMVKWKEALRKEGRL